MSINWSWDWVLWHAGPPFVAVVLLWLKIHFGHRKIAFKIEKLSLQVNGNNKLEDEQKGKQEGKTEK